MSGPVTLRREHAAPLVLVNLGVALHAMIWYTASTMMPSVVGDPAPRPTSVGPPAYLVTMILGSVAMSPAKARWERAGVAAGLGHRRARQRPRGGGCAEHDRGAGGARAAGLGEGPMVALSYALVRELFGTALVPKVFGACRPPPGRPSSSGRPWAAG